MKAAVVQKQKNEVRSGVSAKPFFAKSAENSFFSDQQHTAPFFSGTQAKLTVGQPGDKYEQEADATADQVMRMSTPNAKQVQAQGAVEEQEGVIQTKLRVNRQAEKDDEAKNISAIQSMIQRSLEEEESLQTKLDSKPTSPSHFSVLRQTQTEEEKELIQQQAEKIQKQKQLNEEKKIQKLTEEEKEEEAVQTKLIQRKIESSTMLQAKTERSAAVAGSFESRLSSNKGSGERLDTHTQQFMESRFNADFSSVRVHTDHQAVQMSQQINAQAFAHGNDIYFNRGKYNPGTGEGKQLLAHELTHTIQQGASVHRKPVVVHTHPNANVQANFDFPDIDLPDIDLPDISIDAFRERLGDYANDYLPAYSLLSVVIGYDLIRGQSVARNRDNIIRGIFSLINPFGSLLRQRLEERGIIDDAFTWIDTQLSELGLTRASVEQKFDEFWEEKEIVRTDFLSYNLGLLERKFGPFLTSISQFISRATDQVFTMIKNAFLQLLADLARQLGGYDLLADLLGQDPVTGEERNATTADILRGILRLPIIQAIGGDKLLAKLENENLIERAAAWIDEQWALLQASFTNIYNIATRFVEGFSLATLQDPMGFINGLKEEVVDFVINITQFFRNLASKALELIKGALIGLLKTFINENTYGFDLVKVVLGRDPITGEAYPRTAENIISAFLTLLPNGEELAARMIETGAIQQASDWVMGAIQEFIQVITAIKLAFLNLWATASIDNLFEPIPFFTEILNLFAEPAQRLVAFVRRVLFKLLEILFQIMELPIDLAQQLIANIQRAYQDIRQDPIAFLLNLLGAVKLGFEQFFGNFLPHLLGGLQTWLFSQLAEAGIQPPPDLSFRSILGLVLDIFGISVDNIMDRLAQKIGPERVAQIRAMMDRLTGIWTFVKDVIERGPIAIWELIQEQLSNLWDMVVEGVKNWIMTNIVEKVTTKLLSMLDPTGVMAVINSFIAFYRAVQSFIEQLRAMLEIANSFVAGVVDIARGSLQTAANFLENALSQALPVAIGFLANQVGLRGLGERISEIIGGIRERVNQGIDWLIDRAMSAGSAVLRMLGLGGEEEVSEGTEEIVDSNIKLTVIREVKERVHAANIPPTDHIRLLNLIRSITREFGPQGLKTLSLSIDNVSSMDVTISAEASPVLRETISFDEIFEAETAEAREALDEEYAIVVRGERFTLQEAIETPLEVTYAVVTVDGGMIGRPHQNSSGGHAEEDLVQSTTWAQALNVAQEYLSTDPEAIIPIVLAINRSPCHGCTMLLISTVQNALRRLGPRAHFILASSTQYRGGVDTPGTTREHLNRLEAAGWDVRAIERAETSSSQYRQLQENTAEIKQEYIADFNTRMTSRFS